MQPIQSIICFNGGSGGDLLKMLCMQDPIPYTITENGKIEYQLHYDYFKEFINLVYQKENFVSEIDQSKLYPVENCHYYINEMHLLANKIYFIDYPDYCNRKILEIYKDKVHKTLAEFYKWHKHSLPNFLKDKINDNNIIDVFEIQWLKNLNSWRNNKRLTPIPMSSFVDSKELMEIIKTLTQKQLINIDHFNNVYQEWLLRNKIIQELFTKA